MTDVVLAYRSAAVFIDPDQARPDAVGTELAVIELGPPDEAGGRLLTIPVLYDGPDLEPAVRRLGLDGDRVIEIHTSVDYDVYAIGFLPGFPYAGYLPAELCGLPRSETPRLRVPAGSVAIAGRQTGVYPCESPGGWNLLGRTPLRIADARSGTFPIRAGDRIRFHAIDTREFEASAMSGSEHRVKHRTRGIDLNADLGEGCPNDRLLLERVTSASVCCGAHAGDPATIRQTLRNGWECGVVLGAHPGYPDRDGFGRRERSVTTEEVEQLILEQVSGLMRLAELEVVAVRFLKPHGALYNQAQRQADVAQGVLSGALELSLPLLGQPGTLLETLAGRQGVRFIAEGFPDRRVSRRWFARSPR